MNRIIFSAGQKVHEGLYGGTLTIFGVTIPCTSSKIKDDWILMSGQSSQLFVEKLSFLVENMTAAGVSTAQIAGTRKGIKCTLMLNNCATPVALQLWVGGLVPDGLRFEFQAVDANFKA